MVTAAQHVVSSRRRARVVDDSQIARFVLKDLLQRHGFEVETAETAETAEVGLEKVAADLPGMNGLEAVRQLRSDWPTDHLPIVMYTSQEGEEFARHATAAGANGVYLKTSEGDSPTPLLVRLGLVDAPAQSCKPNVVRLHAEPAIKESRDTADASSDEERLVALLEPILEQHRARLQQELLAEFAILERYEERMRRELITQIETTTRRAITAAVDVIQHNAHQGRACFGAGTKRWERAALLLLALAAGLTFGLAPHFGDTRGSNETVAHVTSGAEPAQAVLEPP